VGRDFHADAPNRLWLTDVTEFRLDGCKAYLSPVIDCYDGKVVSWTLSKHPGQAMANTMLEKAIATLKGGERPVIHSDRGCHYRWPAWIAICDAAGLSRSMSAKGGTISLSV
jgi:transposase InsO family protein